MTPEVGSVWVDTCWPDLPPGAQRLTKIVSVGPTITYQAWTQRGDQQSNPTTGFVSVDLFHHFYRPAQENPT